MSEPLNLIQKALQYAREARKEFENANLGIIEPLYPRARRDHQYLRIRNSITVGCRRSVRLLKDSYKRSMAYSILMQACIDIFHSKMCAEIVDKYNALLDNVIGTH